MQERNADRLELPGPPTLEQIPGESVLRRDGLLHERQMGNFRAGQQVIPQPGGQIAARGGQFTALQGPSQKPPRQVRAHPGMSQAGVQLVRGLVLQQDQHPVIDADSPRISSSGKLFRRPFEQARTASRQALGAS